MSPKIMCKLFKNKMFLSDDREEKEKKLDKNVNM